ncbi:DUF551 domain-containing protein [Klebsiella pneumoniae]|uniref:DUF551 domain-containing protein n=2 Tax=Klebsiella pneumoniae TaxID=573 RepID=UPI000E2DA1B9|nr:DUF551 domain-containing protein [Klebsiella pneumoniae]MDO3485887.1 DUF551 domain-containing protein [Klebsiella pneumoniae]MDO3497114.1 DUF551 domain-containing protein [Klebsiella pneumoniae]MDO3503111.1 DUF551 domain-containing protein [Klebsiella pneumoniae]VVL34808.1 Protein of uncharacterised function (DUF551) [Klebsiella pneumoniae]
MTSKFSIDNRELLQRISSGEAVVGIDFGNLIVRELAAFRLAAMDSEPVAVTGNGLNVALSLTQMQIDWICNTCASIYNTRNDDVAQGYINEIRATLERLAAMDSEPVAWLAIYHGEVYDEAIGITRSVVEAQADHFGWGSALTEIIPLFRHAQPALVIPDEMTAEQAYEIGYYYGDPVNVFARGANWMRQHIIDSTLAAAQHDTPALNSVQSVVTVPGKWIPVSERMPEVGVKVLCFPAEDEPIHAVFNGQLWLQDVSWSGSEEPIDNVIPVTVTHWMPLPAGPQEVR